MEQIKPTQRKTLDDLFKDKWQPLTTIGYNGIVLGRMGERIVWDIITQEITCKYSTEIKR